METTQNAIPVSPSLNELYNFKSGPKGTRQMKTRLLFISALCILIAGLISIIAKGLIYLINIVTNISFYGMLDAGFHSPANNHLGLWVIVIPAIGGIIVGLMALYGSKAIRGHGIPEAMEQILVNKSKIKPAITFLKPVSSAIAIGTGGPFGAEGPIIATGGALGSTIGQLFKISPNERKIILAAGATAGMSAIFGTPIAAVFLAIELLLFEFSPRAILPVALACITGAAGHHVLFEAGPVFPMPNVDMPSNTALAIYSIIGLTIGFIAMGLTKIVYFIEDSFEKLPIHWMWWPALGGLAVGLIGYFAPHTLGVGYDNIISILSGTLSLMLIVRLCFFKFLSWAIALGSGTSGGTLAPLLTIGGAAGAAFGALIHLFFPDWGVSIPIAALVGMASMFAGASRAYLTSITFALEATMQSHALLPLLGACTASYLVSFFLMENTIMTEKIARRGVYTPDSYEPDLLQMLNIADVINDAGKVLISTDTIAQVRELLAACKINENFFIVTTPDGTYAGMVSAADIYNHSLDPASSIKIITKTSMQAVKNNDSLKHAVDIMAEEGAEVLPVISTGDKVIACISYKDILNAYQRYINENRETNTQISLKRRRLKMMAASHKSASMNQKG